MDKDYIIASYRKSLCEYLQLIKESVYNNRCFSFCDIDLMPGVSACRVCILREYKRLCSYQKNIYCPMVKIRQLVRDATLPRRYIEIILLEKYIKSIDWDSWYEENEKKIKMYPGAMRIHHEYIGGFLEHTLSVARTCDYFSGKYGEVNRDLLIAGAILHDIGKLKELSVSNITEYSEEGNLIGHIVLGSDMVKEKARKIEDFPEDKLIQLDHIILSHQGNMEWGSPKPPMTIEALILHYAEDLDAKVNIFKRAVKKDREEGKFTQKDPLLGRVLFKG